MTKHKSDLARRDLLKVLGAASATLPVGRLIRLIADGIIEKAHAAATSATGKRYVYFQQSNAPARWMFDLFLTPYSAGYIANPMVGTVGTLVGGTYTGVTYQTIARKGINVPPMWGMNVPAPGGGTRALDTIMDNLLVIRGIDVANNSHPTAQRLNYQPVGAEYNVMGMVADAGNGFPLKGVSAGVGEFVFNSQKHYAAVQLPRGQGAALGRTLLNPFNSASSANFKTNKAAIQAELDTAKQNLDNYARSQHPGAATIKTVQDDMELLKGTALATLIAKWDTLYAKYDALVKRSLTDVEIPGITDRPFGAPTRPANRNAYLVDGAAVLTPVDMRSMFVPATTVRDLASSFALAELVVTENICSSVTGPIEHLSNLSANGGTIREGNDQHFSGSLATLLLNAKVFVAVGACLAEFVAVLKAQGLFNQTVIHLGGEFNRSPKSGDGGSDHGPQAGSATILSGMVNGPLVIGNVRQNAPSAAYPGSWGWGAPTINGRIMDLGDLANALAVMLGIPEVLRRGASEQIIALNGEGKVVSRVGTASQV